jgi:hypothetical protein
MLTSVSQRADRRARTEWARDTLQRYISSGLPPNREHLLQFHHLATVYSYFEPIKGFTSIDEG